MCDAHVVNAAAQYRQLLQLGRDEFLTSAAPAALVRYHQPPSDLVASASATLTLDDDVEATLPYSRLSPVELELEIYPLIKKPGASFPDRITIGRTGNNDVVIPDTSVSRLHAYIRRHAAGWVLADAGSKNGSWLAGVRLEPRREQPITSRITLRLGDVDLTFYAAADLYGALGGT